MLRINKNKMGAECLSSSDMDTSTRHPSLPNSNLEHWENSHFSDLKSEGSAEFNDSEVVNGAHSTRVVRSLVRIPA
jgi:hypothetical protein